ncbi:MAG: hypothetical protein IPQ07_40000 [Myxococcales bacterium]|nr:hypothetical protein [Myxococcales bacterium]
MEHSAAAVEWLTWAFRGLLGVCAFGALAYFRLALGRSESRQAEALQVAEREQAAALSRVAEQFAARLGDAAKRDEVAELGRQLGRHEVALARDAERWDGVLRELSGLRSGLRRIEGRLLSGRRALPEDQEEGA